MSHSNPLSLALSTKANRKHAIHILASTVTFVICIVFLITLRPVNNLHNYRLIVGIFTFTAVTSLLDLVETVITLRLSIRGRDLYEEIKTDEKLKNRLLVSRLIAFVLHTLTIILAACLIYPLIRSLNLFS